MGYRQRYEDSYLDEVDEEFEGDERSDAQKLIDLIKKTVRTEKEDIRIKKLTERLIVGAKLPGPPGEKAIASIGDTVGENSNVCIIEAMKVMNEIKADARGTIVRVLVEDGKPVQYGQPLFELKA